MKAKNFWFKKKVLIIGSTGFIGTNLLAALKPLSPIVGILVRNLQVAPKVDNVYIGDLCDAEIVSTIVSDFSPDIVIHLAATRARSLKIKTIRESIEINLLGTLNLLEALESSGKPVSMIFLGSAEEYGTADAPYNENTREQPISAYSYSKVCITHLLQALSRNTKNSFVILRPTVVYGPHQSDNMFVPALISSLHQNKHFPMTHGSQKRDFLFVDDLVEAILVACQVDNLKGEIVNVGSGLSLSILDVAYLVEHLMNVDGFVKPGELASRSVEVDDYAVNLEHAKKLLGWSPKTSLEYGLKRTISWYSNQ